MGGRSDISAGRAFVELYVKNNAFLAGLRSASERLKSWGMSASLAGAAVSGMGAAILAPLAAAVRSFTKAGDELDKMSLRTGVSVVALSQLGFAAEQSGTNIETLEKAFAGLSRTMLDAERGGMAADSLRELGLSLADLSGLDVDKRLELIGDRLAAVDDVARRGALAQAIFGKSGRALLPMLAGGAAGLKAMRDEADALGLTKSEDETKAAAAVGDAINRVTRALGATVFKIGAALAPAVLEFAEITKNVVVSIGRWVRENAGLARTIGMVGIGLMAAGAAIGMVGMGLTVAGVAVGGFASALSLVGSAIGLLMTPAGLIVAALAGAAAAWVKWTASGRAAANAIGTAFTDTIKVGRETIAGISDALMAGDMALAGQIAVAGLRLVVLQGIASLADMVGGQWGEVVSAIGGSLLQGDIQGAWQAGISGLGAAWAQFANYVVKTMSAMAKKVVQLWSGAVSGLAKGMLNLASKDGVIGRMMSKILGVDVRAEMERARKLGRTDAMGEAMADVDRQVGAMADAATNYLDGIELKFDAAAERAATAASKAASPAAAEMRAELARQQAELDKLTGEAKAKAEARRAEMAAAAAGAGADSAIGRSGGGVAGTFSAAALGRLAAGGDVQNRIARGVEAAGKIAKDSDDKLARIERKVGGAFV